MWLCKKKCENEHTKLHPQCSCKTTPLTTDKATTLTTFLYWAKVWTEATNGPYNKETSFTIKDRYPPSPKSGRNPLVLYVHIG